VPRRSPDKTRSQRPSQGAPKPAGFASRDASARLLRQVLTKGNPLDEALAQLDESAPPLAPNDRAFARAMTSMALRRKGQIEEAIARFLTSPLPGQRGFIDDILLSAGAQLLFLDTPAHAAINIAVEQTRRDRYARRYASLVNAVLRRVASSRDAILAEQDAVRLNTPQWLWERWGSHYGEATARAITAQHLLEPPLDLTVKSQPDEWAARLGGIVLPTGTVRLHTGGRIEALEGFAQGAWWVQDAAAALPARLLDNVKGLRVADLCAAPGGKTAQLVHAGARVTAVDQSRKRLERLRGNLSRLGLEAETVTADASRWCPETQFDAVLLDAPCTATGTIRRHPDIMHLKRAADLEKLSQLQSCLLDNAATLLRPQGTMIYCTCSLEPEEGISQIEWLLERRNDLMLEPIDPLPLGARPEWVCPQGVLRTLPHQLACEDSVGGGIDGFFAAKLRKRG